MNAQPHNSCEYAKLKSAFNKSGAQKPVKKIKYSAPTKKDHRYWLSLFEF